MRSPARAGITPVTPGDTDLSALFSGHSYKNHAYIINSVTYGGHLTGLERPVRFPHGVNVPADVAASDKRASVFDGPAALPPAPAN